MTSVARRSGPARHAGAEENPGPRKAQAASRPGPSRRPQAGPAPVRPKNRPAQIGARGLLAAIIAGGVVVIALWWHGSPGVHGLGGWLTGAGEILGLLAGYGVVVLVALMSRLPPLERGLGTDRLARWHAMGGRYVITLVTGHVLFIVWGYAVTAHEKVTNETVALLTAYPDVLMATVAGSCCSASASSRSRRAPPGLLRDVVLRAPVYLPGDRARVQPPVRRRPLVHHNLAARLSWSAMYLTVPSLILWYRISLPLLEYRRHRFRSSGRRRRRPASSRCSSPARDSTGWTPSPGSSSAGGS